MERIENRFEESQALTHYDDLGLPAGASDGEIREAYLNLIRLLHQDSPREKNLNRFAESQMKRVSRAYAVLSDPARRLRYDAELVRSSVGDSKVASRRKRIPARAIITFGWLICAFSGMIGIGWYVSRQSAARGPTEVKAAPAPT